MVGYIREAKMPKEVWVNLKKIFVANTTAQKLQLRQELNNIQHRDMSIGSYTLKIKELCDSLGSINASIDDNEIVQICLSGLAPSFGAIWSIVLVRENTPSFDLKSMLLIEENHVRTIGNASNGQILYTNSDEVRGQVHGRRGQSGQGQNNQRQPRNKTSTTNRTLQTHEAERQEEGGVVMLDRANRITPPSANIVTSLAIMRQSVAKSKVTRPSRINNSLTTPPTPTITIMAEYF